MQVENGHNALLIANKLIEGAKKNNEASFTPMQLIKMVYIAHGWMLGLFGHPLIKQPVEAWKYGPVVPDVYYAIKHYRNKPVNECIGGVAKEAFDDYELELIDKIREVYGTFSGVKLSAITHETGTPWNQVVLDRKTFGRGVVIPNSLIEKYYKNRLENH